MIGSAVAGYRDEPTFSKDFVSTRHNSSRTRTSRENKTKSAQQKASSVFRLWVGVATSGGGNIVR